MRWLWKGSSHGSGGAGVSGVAVHGTGEATLVGRASGGLGLGAGLELATAVGQDSFIARLRADGTARWAKRFTSFNEPLKVFAAADGSAIAFGRLWGGPSTFGAGEPGETTLPAPGNGYQAFIAKYGNDGKFEWVRRVIDPALGSYYYDAGMLEDGSVVVFGTSRGPVTFDPSGEVLTPANPLGYSSTTVFARFGANGDLLWARRIEVPLETVADGAFCSGKRCHLVVRCDSGCIDSFSTTQGPGSVTAYPGYGLPLVLLTVDESGDILSARVLAAGFWNQGLAALDDGSILVASDQTGDSTVFAPGVSGEIALTPARGSELAIIARLRP